VQVPARQVSHVAQELTQVPPTPQVRHWVSSQVLWQTPATQAWHRVGLQGPQLPFTHVWQEPHRVWQVPLMQSSQAPHWTRQVPATQAWHAPASQSSALLSMIPSQSSSTPLQISGGSAAEGLWTL